MDFYENALLHSGKLLIKTESALGHRSWILRHVLLANRTVEWYGDANHKELIGSVSLDGASVMLPADGRYPHMFELDWDGQDYLPLRALNAHDLRDWVLVSCNGCPSPPLAKLELSAEVACSCAVTVV